MKKWQPVLALTIIAIVIFYLISKKREENKIRNFNEFMDKVIEVSANQKTPDNFTKQIFISPNDTVRYYYKDSTMNTKLMVNKKGFQTEKWIMVVTNDSLEFEKDTLKLNVINMYNDNPYIRKVEVYLSNSMQSRKLINSVNYEYNYEIEAKVKGINKLDIELYSDIDTTMRKFNFFVY